MDRETGIVFFLSGLVILIGGTVIVVAQKVSRRYMVYRVVPMAGFFGAFGLAILIDPAGRWLDQAALAALQTAAVMLILHVFIGRRLRG